MATWSGIRRRLERDYLAASLRGHIQYFVTRYEKSHDCEGRAAIRLDGEEILKGSYINQFIKEDQYPRDETYARRVWEEFAFMDDTAMRLGLFDQRAFYEAFGQFDNQSIGDSLRSENLLVRIFAVMDRRVGKRRIAALLDDLSRQPASLRPFIRIRGEAEGILSR